MDALRSNRWLIGGLFVATLIPLTGIDLLILDRLAGVVPLPWGRIGLGLLLFVAALSFHFRSRWIACQRDATHAGRRVEAAARRIAAAERDGVRWLRVIQENLELVDDPESAARLDEIYLSGARAHADKLEQAFQRIGGTRRAMVAAGPEPGGPDPTPDDEADA